MGLVVPGLGHLLTGDVKNGVGMLLELGVLLLALVLGLPRIGSLLFPDASAGGFALHPWVALLSWFGFAALLWYFARQHAQPDKNVSRENQSQWQLVWRQFKKNRMGVIGLHCVVLLAMVTLLTPFLAPHDPDLLDVGPQKSSPSLSFLMGTDEFGRDMLSRLLYGARISLSIGFLAVVISGTFGAIWGAMSGYFGGRVDTVMVWLTDFMLSMPRLVLVLTIVGLFRPSGAGGIYLIVLVLGLTGWMGVSRIVRGLVLSLKEQDFIQAARALGQQPSIIILKHLIPNAIAPVIVHATLGVGNTILTEAALSFLGLGVPPPISTWGSIVNDGREFLRTLPWIAAFPGLLIVFAVTSFNMLGDGLRDALDPKLRSR